MTPTDKQNLWDAIFKLRNMPYTGSGYPAYNNVKNPALRGGLYYWTQRDMINLFNELVLYCESGKPGSCWKVLLGYKTKIYPAYLRKIYQTLNCGSIPTTCPALGDTWHGGIVFFIDGDDYYIVSPDDFEPSVSWFMCQTIGFNLGTNPDIPSSYDNTLFLQLSPCGPALADEALLIPENGYNDWFIPSIQALVEIDNLGLGILTPKTDYWSSTEDGDNNMFLYGNGSTSTFDKASTGPAVRRIRKETCI